MTQKPHFYARSYGQWSRNQRRRRVWKNLNFQWRLISQLLYRLRKFQVAICFISNYFFVHAECISISNYRYLCWQYYLNCENCGFVTRIIVLIIAFHYFNYRYFAIPIKVWKKNMKNNVPECHSDYWIYQVNQRTSIQINISKNMYSM